MSVLSVGLVYKFLVRTIPASAFLVLFQFPLPLLAQTTSAVDLPSIFKNTVYSVYQPAFQQFSQITGQFAESVEAGCKTHSAEFPANLREQFYSVVTAFSGIELYRMGPLTVDNRYNRLFYWPDKRHVGERQLQQLLLEPASVNLTSDSLTSKSVALQGLPAMERLLFSAGADAYLARDSGTPHCQVLVAIAQNMNSMAGALEVEWADTSEFVRNLRNPAESSSQFRNDKEVLRSMVTQAIVGIDLVLEEKILPLAENGQKLNRAPLWLSRQTVTMIDSNVESLRALVVEIGLAGASNLVDELSFEFRTSDQLLLKLAELPTLTSEQGQISQQASALFKSLATVTTGIKRTLEGRFSEYLGVKAGFNSGDGD